MLIVAGCGADLLINILLTLLGYVVVLLAVLVVKLKLLKSYFPGHIHAFWIEYVYYKRRGEAGHNVYDPPKTGIYSKKVQYPRGHAQHSTMDDTTHYAETPMAPALAPVAPAPGPVPMDYGTAGGPAPAYATGHQHGAYKS